MTTAITADLPQANQKFELALGLENLIPRSQTHYVHGRDARGHVLRVQS